MKKFIEKAGRYLSETVQDEIAIFKGWANDVSLRMQELQDKLPDSLFYPLIERDIKRLMVPTPPLNAEFNYFSALREVVKNSRGADKTIKLSKEEKELHLAESRKLLARQIEGMASCRIILERILARDPDISEGRVVEYLERFTSAYGIPKEKNMEYRKIIHDFFGKKYEVGLIRAIFKNDSDLFRAIFPKSNVSPESFKISKSSFNLIFEGSLENINKIFNERMQNDSDKLEQPGGSVGGFSTKAISPVTQRKIPLIFIPNNSWNDKQVLVHETTHTINQTLLEFSSNHDLVNKVLELIKNSYKYKNIEGFERIQREILFTVVQSLLQDSLERAKDEILAMKKDGNSSYFDILGVEENYIYSLDDLDKIKNELNSLNIPELSSFIDTIKQRFFTQIKVSVEQFDTLMKDGGFSSDETVAILTTFPLTSWKRVVPILLKTKN